MPTDLVKTPLRMALWQRDRALMGMINGPYKAECIRSSTFHDGPYMTVADVEYETAAWVEWYGQ